MVEIQIRPEPSPEERAAIERALASVAAGKDPRGAWWLAGVREAAGLDDGEQNPAS